MTSLQVVPCMPVVTVHAIMVCAICRAHAAFSGAVANRATAAHVLMPLRVT